MKSFLDQINTSQDVELSYLMQSPNHREIKEFLEKLWQDYSPYASEKTFIGDCKNNAFHSRFWEMYLGCALLEQNFQLEVKKEHGPDICINNSKIWIEARTSTDGNIGVMTNSNESMNRVPDFPPLNQPFGIPEEKIILRYQSAISEKIATYNKYVQDKVINENEPYVIALNVAKVAYSIFDHQYTNGNLPTIFKTLFPVGNDVVISRVDLNSGQSSFDYSMYEYRPTLFKINNQGKKIEIDMNGFLREENKGISGLLYSKVGISWLLNWIPKKLAEGFIFIHNPIATNPLPKGWLKAGQEYWFDGDILTKFDYEKNTMEQNYQVLRKDGTWNLVDVKRQQNIEF